jgi:hypothetical protein
MAKKLNLFQYRKKTKVRRRGVHAKSKTSNLKTSKNYVKQYRGQGR